MPARFAAMEPVLGGRDDLPSPTTAYMGGSAAMEPVLGGRDDQIPGTGPGGTGRKPQWSPSLADGTTVYVR